MAMSAASRAVIPPTAAMTVQAVSVKALAPMLTCRRTSMYTPAATIVAAWMRAETGVGPSMASGSHTCSGNWADLPTAPQKRHSTMTVSTPPCIRLALPAISPKSSVPNTKSVSRMPMRKPKSPTRLVIKAFLAASAAEALWNQWPMSR